MHQSVTKNRLNQFLPVALREVDTLLDQFFHTSGQRSARGLYTPASIWEEETSYHVELDVPGVDRDNVELTFEKDTLRIAVERTRGDEKQKPSHEERTFGKAVRKIGLSESVDPDSIVAELKDGVLHVSISKKAEAQPKRIEVK